jgi:hypothetical protein
VILWTRAVPELGFAGNRGGVHVDCFRGPRSAVVGELRCSRYRIEQVKELYDRGT